MKNKGFLNRSRIGDSIAHKEVASSLNPTTEITAPFITPLPASATGTDSGIRPVAKAEGPISWGTSRYTLILHVPESASERLGRYLGQFPTSRRAAARRALVSAFMAEVQMAPRFNAAPLEEPFARLRVDLRLTDQLRDALLAKVNAGLFEPKASALARYLAPVLAGFISTRLDP